MKVNKGVGRIGGITADEIDEYLNNVNTYIVDIDLEVFFDTGLQLCHVNGCGVIHFYLSKPGHMYHQKKKINSLSLKLN